MTEIICNECKHVHGENDCLLEALVFHTQCENCYAYHDIINEQCKFSKDDERLDNSFVEQIKVD